MSESEIDTFNEFMVSGTPNFSGVGMLRPPRVGESLTKDQALTLAAWIVAIADPTEKRFQEIKRAVMNT